MVLKGSERPVVASTGLVLLGMMAIALLLGKGCRSWVGLFLVSTDIVYGIVFVSFRPVCKGPLLVFRKSSNDNWQP